MYAFIHPLLGARDDWSAYLIEFPRGGDARIMADLIASSRFGHFDRRPLWLYPAAAHGDDVEVLAERAVIIFDAEAMTDDQSRLANTLHQAGRKLCLRVTPQTSLPAGGPWDSLMLRVSHARSLSPPTLAGGPALLLTETLTLNDRAWLLAHGGIASTGEYLLARSSSGNRPDMANLKLLKLLGLIEGDADTAELEAVFRQEPKLSYSLLRLVNSAALASRAPITGFAQAINLLGRRPLQRWLQLLAYANLDDARSPTPLLPKAAARGRLLELLAPRIAGGDAGAYPDDLAFMIGTFSLLDALLDMRMAEILRHLSLPAIAERALIDREGPLGKLLEAIDQADRRHLQAAARKLDHLGIGARDHLEAQLDALCWASQIGQST